MGIRDTTARGSGNQLAVLLQWHLGCDAFIVKPAKEEEQDASCDRSVAPPYFCLEGQLSHAELTPNCNEKGIPVSHYFKRINNQSIRIVIHMSLLTENNYELETTR